MKTDQTDRKPDKEELRKIRTNLKAGEALKRFCTKNGQSIAVLVYCNADGNGGISTFGSCDDCRLQAKNMSARIMQVLEFSQKNHP